MSRRLKLPHQKIAAGLHAARASVSRARGPDWEDPETVARLREFVRRNHEVLVTAARHEASRARGSRSPAVALAARSGAAVQKTWVRSLWGADTHEESFRILATLALAGGILHGREPAEADADVEWAARAVTNAFDPHLVVKGAEWAGALALPVLRGPWAVGVAAALLVLAAAAPALTGASVLYEARRSTIVDASRALLAEAPTAEGREPAEA